MALISVAEALDRVLSHAAPLPHEQVPLDDALGRVLAADVVNIVSDCVVSTSEVPITIIVGTRNR